MRAGGSGMRVELLHFEGCPLAPAAYRLVRQCLIALGIPDPVLVRVGDWPVAHGAGRRNRRDAPGGGAVEGEGVSDRRADPGARAGRPDERPARPSPGTSHSTAINCLTLHPRAGFTCVSGADHVVVHPTPLDLRFRDSGERFGMVSAMSVDESDERPAAPFQPPSPSQVRRRAYEAVHAVLSDDHNYERGVEEAWAVARATLAEFGAVGLAAVAVELSLQLASALERIATEQDIAAVDLAEVWFVD